MDYYKDEEGEWLDYDQTSDYIGGYPRSALALKRRRDEFNWIWKKVPASGVSRGYPGKRGAVIGISRKSLDEYLQSLRKPRVVYSYVRSPMLKKYKIHFKSMVCTREANSVEEFYGKMITIPVNEDLVESIEDVEAGIVYRISKRK